MRRRDARALGVALSLATLPSIGRAAPADARPTGPAAAAPFVAKARQMHLARSAGWERLVHYRERPWEEQLSDVDGQDFFLAPDGRHDPGGELEATLKAFLEPVVPGREDAHALCRFPARRAWLGERLGFQGPLRSPRCPALSRYLAATDAESFTVVYSANFLGNPASAFGHTFLRLKKRRPAGSTEPSERLDYGIDFVAVTDTNNPLLYAFKGLTGLFPGVVRFHSFEYKTREYGNEEARDLWEYDLALSPAEVEMLTLHLWELSGTHIDYLYLTKNCSYGVLAALEAAAPRVDLISKLKTVVLPKDTIKALFTVPGLVRGMDYRPSLRSRFRAQVARLGPAEKDLVELLAGDPQAPLPRGTSLAETVSLLDTAVFVVDARLGSTGATGDARLAATRAALLSRRATLSASLPQPPPLPPPTRKAPQHGHGSLRLMLGSGASTQHGGAYETFGYRLALHDLADPPDGEPELAQVQFVDVRARYDVTRRVLTLDSLTFAELLALNPLTRFEKAASWRARALGMRLHDRGCPDCFAHGVDAAVGGTLATEDEHLAIFVMADAYVLFSGAQDGIAGSFVRAGVGPYAGLRVRLPADVLGVLTASWSYLPGERVQTTYDLRATVRAGLAKDVALGVEAAAQPLSAEVQIGSYFYF